MFIEDCKQGLRRKYSKEKRTGIHVSDLLLCPRKSIFDKIKPQKIGDLELSFFTTGRMAHEAIQATVEDNPDYVAEHEINYEGTKTGV